jgi:hypothetical protein
MKQLNFDGKQGFPLPVMNDMVYYYIPENTF